jgi:predicted transcriptional regulator
MEDTKMDKLEDINNDIKFLVKSEIRLKILSELNKQPNNIRGIVKKTKITYSSVSSNIGKLEKKNYITKTNKKYYVNPMTEVYFNSIMEFKQSVDLINEYDKFWDKHDLNQLSIESMKNITDLKDSRMIETTPVDIFKTHNAIKEQIMQSKNVKAIFPYLHPEYPKLIEDVLNNQGSIELIIPQSIFKEFFLRINRKTRKTAERNGKLRIYEYENDLNLYLALCDESISLGLFRNDGSFDQNRILISDNHKSNVWASELFEHVKKQVAK